MISTGKPLELGFNSRDAAKSLGYLVLKAQFPRKLPPDMMTKVQDLMNRLRSKVDETNIDSLTRKPLERLGDDLLKISDSLLEEARTSPDGIYTDYLKAKIDGVPLEDALFNVGLQLKAYYVDLTNYQTLVNWLLSLPAVPAFASSLTGAINSAPSIEGLRDITKQLTQNPLQPIQGFTNVMRNALQLVTPVNQIIDTGPNSRLSSYGQLVSSPLTSLGFA